MTLCLDVELDSQQQLELNTLPAAVWFTQVKFRNAESPSHPERALAENNAAKQAFVQDWITREVAGKRVLDLFSANGAFAVQAALAGAREVVGLEYDAERVRCAQFVASTLPEHIRPRFLCGDVYRMREYFDEPFDVVLCLGGLYHIADPAYLLSQIRGMLRGRLILQTAQVLPLWGKWARFGIRRRDKRSQGLSSVRGGYGTWSLSPGCLRELLEHSGFDVLEERRPTWRKRFRFPWYGAVCSPMIEQPKH
jgi:2-polyprenyl-3-methyl-5-hydroxy-6-metoxy-1,4-benzoquinol methylase